jgi:hypothetical protein
LNLFHGCGYALINKGADLRALQSYLGHVSVTHTCRYVDRPACCTENKEARRGAGPEGAWVMVTENCRGPVELSVAVFEGDDVGVTEAARHGANDFKLRT